MITGTNDAPVVATTDITGAVTEQTATPPTGNIENSGTIAFTDADFTNSHSISSNVASAGALGTLTPTITQTGDTGLDGIISWTYSVQASTVEYLAAAETKVETFTITLSDGNSTDDVERIITVTITGTNDAPVVALTDVTGTVTEQTGTPSGNITNPGTITFTDADFGDSHTVTINAPVPTASMAPMIVGSISYSTVVIGDQIWTSENMRHGTGSGILSYANNPANDANGKGKLYTRSAAMAGSTAENAQGICADGWHIPSDQDWKDLEGALGMTLEEQNKFTSSLEVIRGTDQGAQLRNGGSSGFNWKFVGFQRDFNKQFFSDNSIVNYWTSTTSMGRFWIRYFRNSAPASVSRQLISSFSLGDKYSVRCVKPLSSIPIELEPGDGTLTLTPIITQTGNDGQGGVISWEYSVPADDVEYLAEGETKVQTFAITLNDGHSSIDRGDIDRTITVTTTGTNDEPSIMGTDENIEKSLTETNEILTTTGTLTVLDVDIIDTVTATIESLATPTATGLSKVPVGTDFFSMNLLSLNKPDILSNSETTAGLIWTFDAGANAFNYLGTGQRLIFKYTIKVEDIQSDDTEVVTLIITGTNDSPAATARVGDTITENESITVPVLENVTDADADDDITNFSLDQVEIAFGLPTTRSEEPATATITDNQLVFNPGKDFDYLTDGENIDVIVRYTMSDNEGAKASTTATITIVGESDAPVGVDETVTTAEDTPITILVLANDSDADTDASLLIITNLSTPSDGTATLTNNDTEVIYTPNANFNGDDTFTYTPNDGDADGQEVTVTVRVRSVNDLPFAVPDTRTITENEEVTIPVLANDTDADDRASFSLDLVSIASGLPTPSTSTGTPATATITTDNRQLVFNPGTDFDYLASGEEATVVVNYTMSDDEGATSSSTATIIINGTNDTPVAVADIRTITENEEVTIPVLANDTDADDSSTNISLDLVSIASGLPTSPTGTPATATITNNQLVFNPGTDFDYLSAGVTTDVVVNYTMSDDEDVTSSSTATITITGTDDVPTITGDPETIVIEGADYLFAPGGGDVDTGDTPVYSITGNPSWLSVTPGTGILRGTPVNSDIRATTGIVLKITSGGEETSITFDLEVINANYTPVAVADTRTARENEEVIIDVLANDTDRNTDDNSTNFSLDAISITSGLPTLPTGTPATATIRNNQLVFNPGTDFDYLAFGGRATVVVNYTMSDDEDATSSSTATIIITGIDDVPIANAGPDQIANVNTLITLDGSSSVDPEGEELTYQWSVITPGVTLSNNTAAMPTFTIPIGLPVGNNFIFSLIVNDGVLNSLPTTVTVEVTIGVISVPTASATTTTPVVPERTLVTLDGSESSSGNPNSDLAYIWTSPAGITLSRNADMSPTFTAPILSVDTNYEFSLRVYNGETYSQRVTVEVMVRAGENNVPTAVATTITPTASQGSVVTLDGSSSTDIESSRDNIPLTYRWTAPLGITLDDNTAAMPTFTAPSNLFRDTDFEFGLIVNDGAQDSQPTTVTVRVTGGINVPTAVAKTTTPVVPERTLVTLDGSDSSSGNPNDSNLSYIWTSPAGINLSSNAVMSPTFTAPILSVDTNYEFSLEVYNGNTRSQRVTLQIMVRTGENRVPTAVATTARRTVSIGTVVTLSGSSSTDPERIPLTYRWTSPLDITLDDNTAENPKFTAPSNLFENTDYEFSLIVNDGAQDSQPATVTVRVTTVSLSADQFSIKNISISPNPASDFITINNIDRNTTYTLSNIIGRIIKKGALTEGKSSVDISSLSRGIYLLNIRTDKGSITKKLLKK